MPKNFTIIDAIQHKDVFGSLPAFANLETWLGWLAWLKSVFALPMDESEQAIYRQCTGRTQLSAKQPAEIYTIGGCRGGKSFISSLTACFIACFSDFRQYLIERDPEGAQAEWLAAFRTDLQAAFSPEALEVCTVKGRYELPSSPFIEYRAFTDPSGGKADSFSLAIGHRGESGAVVIDLVRAWDPPFSPKDVTVQIAEVLKAYGCLTVTGDRFAAEWPIAEFQSHGIAYQQAEINKSELYLAFVPVTNSRGVELPDDKRLFTQLRRLERKRGRAGKDTVDHPPRLHDDLANAVAGVCHLLSNTDKTKPRGEFNPSLHVARQNLKFIEGTWPLLVGVRCDDTFAASVIAQAYGNEVRAMAAFLSQETSLKHHLAQLTNRREPIFSGLPLGITPSP